MTMKHLAAAGLLFALGACMTPAGDATPLAGTSWRFTSIDGAPPVAERTSLAFGDRLTVNAGCNGMSGPWRIEDGRLVAGPLIATRMFCEGKMGQESAVSALLSGNPTVAVEGDRLTLTASGHSAVLARVS
jgi:heat shock protein HslJ